MHNKIVPQIVSVLVFAVYTFLFPQSINAQSAAQDTLAVRVILNENGLTTTPISTLVTKNSAGRIIGLDLSNLKIVKVTSEIGVMSELQSLVLYNNVIDSLPIELWQLDKLTVLDLSNNKLGHLNPAIGQLKSLLFLSARSNGLTTLPAELFSLTQLEILLVSHNALDTISDSIIKLPFLKYLNLANNQLRTLPNSFAVMTQLDSLDFAGNQISALPELISGLTTTAVHLSDNHLCNLSASLETWATNKDPTWKASQTCGIIKQSGGIIRQRKLNSSLFVNENFRTEIANIFGSRPNSSLGIRILNLKGKSVYNASVTKNTLANTLFMLSEKLDSNHGQKLWIQIDP